jgi:hypothetical protein
VDSLIYGQTPGFINTALGGTGGVTFKQADVRDVATMRHSIRRRKSSSRSRRCRVPGM